MDEILTTARDLELEVNKDDIEELIVGHEDELMIEELQETQRNVSPSEQEEDERGPMPTSAIKDLLKKILQCESELESPKIYELLTVTYGIVSAPYVSTENCNTIVDGRRGQLPYSSFRFTEQLLHGRCPLWCCNVREEAIVLRQQIKGILKNAGMELHKLRANHEKMSPDPKQNYNFVTLTETKTLGMSWRSILDCFLIKVKVCLDSSLLYYTHVHKLRIMKLRQRKRKKQNKFDLFVKSIY
ncbi:uncharacterized protein TNCV_3950631 [Trichonephila clavipes]|nr:uncharacterized protein TNCV_3950631 [Trichonephila clavipes]